MEPRRRGERVPPWKRRGERHPVVVGIAIVLVLPLLLISLPFLLPVLAWQENRERKHLQCDAAVFQCLRCGNVLGLAALKLAEEDLAKEFAKLHSRHPELYLRMAPRRLKAICPHCGERYAFDSKRRTLSVLLPEPWELPRAEDPDARQSSEESVLFRLP